MFTENACYDNVHRFPAFFFLHWNKLIFYFHLSMSVLKCSGYELNPQEAVIPIHDKLIISASQLLLARLSSWTSSGSRTLLKVTLDGWWEWGNAFNADTLNHLFSPISIVEVHTIVGVQKWRDMWQNRILTMCNFSSSCILEGTGVQWGKNGGRHSDCDQRNLL